MARPLIPCESDISFLFGRLMCKLCPHIQMEKDAIHGVSSRCSRAVCRATSDGICLHLEHSYINQLPSRILKISTSGHFILFCWKERSVPLTWAHRPPVALQGGSFWAFNRVRIPFLNTHTHTIQPSFASVLHHIQYPPRLEVPLTTSTK